MAQQQTLADVFAPPGQDRRPAGVDLLGSLIAPKPPVAIPLDLIEPVAGQPYPGWSPTGVAVGSVALEFLKGLRQAKVARSLEQEQDAQRSMETYVAAATQRLQDPDLTPEARQQAEAQMMMTLAQHANRELKDTPRKGIGGAIRGILSQLSGGEIPTREPVNFREATGQLLVWTDPNLNPQGRQSYWIQKADEQLNQEIQQLRERFGGYVPPEAVTQKAAEIAAQLGLTQKAPDKVGTWFNLVQLRSQGMAPQEEMKWLIFKDIAQGLGGGEPAAGSAAAAGQPAPPPVVAPPQEQQAPQAQQRTQAEGWPAGAAQPAAEGPSPSRTSPQSAPPAPVAASGPTQAAAPSGAIQALMAATSPEASLASVPPPPTVAAPAAAAQAPAAPPIALASTGAAPAVAASAGSPPVLSSLPQSIQRAVADPVKRPFVYEAMGLKLPPPTVVMNPSNPEEYAYASFDPLRNVWVDPSSWQPLPAHQQRWLPKDQLPPGTGAERYQWKEWADANGVQRYGVFDNRTGEFKIAPFVGGSLTSDKWRQLEFGLSALNNAQADFDRKVAQADRDLAQQIARIQEDFASGVYTKALADARMTTGAGPIYDDTGKQIVTPDQMRDWMIRKAVAARQRQVENFKQHLENQLRDRVYPILKAAGWEDLVNAARPRAQQEGETTEEAQPVASGRKGSKQSPEDFGYAPRHPERAPSAPISKEEQERYRNMVRETARKYGVDPDLAEAVARQESGFKPWALSEKNAMGLMQIIPSTARSLGLENPWDPQQNAEAGVRLLAQLIQKHDGNLVKALAEYNAGPNVAAQATTPSSIPIAETRSYVNSILGSLGFKTEQEMASASVPVPSAQQVQAQPQPGSQPTAQPQPKTRIPPRQEVDAFFLPASAPSGPPRPVAPGKGGAAGAAGGGGARVPPRVTTPASVRQQGNTFWLPGSGAK
jgi:soluble lytic murein transglycosylase-like protein